MIVVVTGGRGYVGDIDDALNMLHQQNPITLIVHGDARGVDRRCAAWANRLGIHAAAVPALWDTHGRGAGPKRNSAMLILKPEYCVAFPGGSGTADMVRRVERARIPLWKPYG
ncbi:hypothetical protein NVP1089O_89 [Vibrio phage 1.089.O._10N.261.51.F9]|nr:hypothetical protein NVP1012O_90 [Vibrio phage 1.012.O._10N.261.48.C12]AUR86827.1 hypothetical protein NVP1089O_89 [Vibrio phage 1.089.O._10N.261.51.F9]AUR87333.1 hypothetical protein NVP1098O_89 [Vibrio phage 1.098.O._10N.286.51.B9]AUR91434.1 hypothetical protein NVP1160O_85 [Vibrio phage 1.160.O._10N.261.48.B11]